MLLKHCFGQLVALAYAPLPSLVSVSVSKTNATQTRYDSSLQQTLAGTDNEYNAIQRNLACGRYVPAELIAAWSHYGAELLPRQFQPKGTATVASL